MLCQFLRSTTDYRPERRTSSNHGWSIMCSTIEDSDSLITRSRISIKQHSARRLKPANSAPSWSTVPSSNLALLKEKMPTDISIQSKIVQNHSNSTKSLKTQTIQRNSTLLSWHREWAAFVLTVGRIYSISKVIHVQTVIIIQQSTHPLSFRLSRMARLDGNSSWGLVQPKDSLLHMREFKWTNGRPFH